MKTIIGMLIFILSLQQAYACSIKDVHGFIKRNLDSPAIKYQDLSIKNHEANIKVVTYKKGCNFLGCTQYVFKKLDNSCFELMGSYHGKLKQTREKLNNHPVFKLSYSTGDIIKVFYDPKKNSYTTN